MNVQQLLAGGLRRVAIPLVLQEIIFILFLFYFTTKFEIFVKLMCIVKVKSAELIEGQEFYSTSPQTFGKRLVCLSCCQKYLSFLTLHQKCEGETTLRYFISCLDIQTAVVQVTYTGAASLALSDLGQNYTVEISKENKFRYKS